MNLNKDRGGRKRTKIETFGMTLLLAYLFGVKLRYMVYRIEGLNFR